MRLRGWLGILLAILLVVLVVSALFWFVRRQQTGPTSPTPPPSTIGTWYEAYFTDPKYPDRPETRVGGIDERFVEFVDGAARSLDIAAYDFDLENVARAMARAQARGVRVRMVTDRDTVDNVRDERIQLALAVVRDGGVPIVPDERGAIMHHKFAVRDAADIWTGSWNLTTGDTYRLNNNAVLMRSPELALLYATEFEEMFSQRKFGPSKPRAGSDAPIQIGQARVQALFSPGAGVAAHIAGRISQATSRVSFMAFSFTHDGIGKALMERSAAGVSISGVFEKTGSETRFSEFGPLKQAGLDVYQDGNPYVMHHKVFLIDDRTVIFGSFNFSDAADRENDENCLVVEDPALAAAFHAEFERVLARARNPAPARATPDRERPR